MDSYERQFGSLPSKKPSSPFADDDHHELDNSKFLNQAGISLYQSMIRTLQWCVTFGMFDINYAVMNMSKFRIGLCQIHMDIFQRIYGYFKKNPKAKIKFYTGIPKNEKF